MNVRFPNESSSYRAARAQLLKQEIELRRMMEAGAAARRALPPGGAVPEDYTFQGVRRDGSTGDVRLSELFEPGKPSLAIYNFMFPRYPTDDRPGPATGSTSLLPLPDGPCPSCTALLDQLDGTARHVTELMNLRRGGQGALAAASGL